ncbi:MAG: ATPase domain-containing protein [Pirellulaceae bacterium]
MNSRMVEQTRQSTGIPALDKHLGGGLVPGTSTVIVGATGIGKTQAGLQFLHAGKQAEGQRGVIFDMCSRGDSQNHSDYAQRMFGWQMRKADPSIVPNLSQFFDAPSLGDYLRLFEHSGRRVTRQDLEWDEWRYWQIELNAKLRTAVAFLYGNFVSGRQRVVVDGIEPVDTPHDSIQLQLYEYIYHQVLRKEANWVARDLFRESYRANESMIADHTYDPAGISCMLLYTSRESMLEELIARPLDEGDMLSNANTVILMGKIRDGMSVKKALYVAKHRGSACSDQVLTFTIDDRGIRLD